MKLSEILEDVEVIELIDCDGDAEVSFVTNDSRSIIPGSVFVAILGERLDGHEFVDEAVGKGARAVVIERPIYPPPKCGIVRVVSTHRALGTLASNYFNCPSKTLRMIIRPPQVTKKPISSMSLVMRESSWPVRVRSK